MNKKKLQSLLKKGKISEREYEIIRLRIEEKMTFQDIGLKYGLTRERARQIYAKHKAP